MENTSLLMPIILMIVYLAIIILLIASMWKIYTKAGQPGWACIVPIYNVIVLLRIVGKPTWWLFMMLMPLVSFVFFPVSVVLFGIVYFITLVVTIVYVVWTYNMLSKSFGRDEGFTAGLILLGFVFFPILGFGSATYLGPYGNPQAFAAYNNRDAFDFEQNKLHH